MLNKGRLIMGRHGDATSFIYKNPAVIKPSIPVQRRILELGKRNIDEMVISRLTGCYLSTVKTILERGIVYLESNDTPVRCHECGCKLVASPCLRCELLTRNN